MGKKLMIRTMHLLVSFLLGPHSGQTHITLQLKVGTWWWKPCRFLCALPMLYREGKDWHMTPSNSLQGALYPTMHLHPERRAPLCQVHRFVILPSCHCKGGNNTLVWFVSSNLYGPWSHSLLHYSNLPWKYCWNFTRLILMKTLIPSSASQGNRSR